MECNLCGKSDREVRLVDAISGTGLVKLCVDCADSEGVPLIKKPTTHQLKESEKNPVKFTPGKGVAVQRPKTDEVSLRSLVDRNYKQGVSKERKPRPDLIPNFHWIIMRARRNKKLTQKQLAKELSESEAAIEMAEKGILPEDDYKLVSKLESYLGINLVNSEHRKEVEKKQPARVLKFDPHAAKGITISDLKKLKEMKERAILVDEGFESAEIEEVGPKNLAENSEPEFEFGEEDLEKEEEIEEKRELSKEDVRDILFRR